MAKRKLISGKAAPRGRKKAAPKKTPPIFKLPPELLRMLDDELDYADATCLSLTCKEFYTVFSKPTIPCLPYYHEMREFRVKNPVRADLKPIVEKAIEERDKHYHAFLIDRGPLMLRLKTYMTPVFGDQSRYCIRCLKYYRARQGQPRATPYCRKCVRPTARSHVTTKARRHIAELKDWLNTYEQSLALAKEGKIDDDELEKRMWKIECDDEGRDMDNRQNRYATS